MFSFIESSKRSNKILSEIQEGWSFECEEESGIRRRSRGSWGPESADSAVQNAKFGGLYAKSNSEPLKSLRRAGTCSESHLGKKTLDCRGGGTVNKTKG